MTQNFSNNEVYANDVNSFRDYLNSSKNDMFALDLSSSTVIECIDKMCEIKAKELLVQFKKLINFNK